MLEIKNLNKSFGFIHKINVIKDIDIKILKGECLAIVGPNGTGKSTTIKIITGLINNYNGEIRINGKIAYIPEFPAVYNYLTARETLKFFKSIINPDCDIDKLLDYVNLNNKNICMNFSKGMKKKLDIAIALISDADIYIMDEPFDGLDPVFSNELIKLINSIKNNGKSIIITSHNLNYLDKISDNVLMINNGFVLNKYKLSEIKDFIIGFSSEKNIVEKNLNSINLKFDISEYPDVKISYNGSLNELMNKIYKLNLETTYAKKESLEEMFKFEYNKK